MGVLGSLGQLYMFILLVLLFMGSGFALWSFISHLTKSNTNKTKSASQQMNINQNKERKILGGFKMTNNGWFKLAIFSFVGILISMAVLGVMTTNGTQGNINNNMQMQGNMNGNAQMQGNMNGNTQMQGNMNGNAQMQGNIPVQYNMNGNAQMSNDPTTMMMQQLNQMQQQMNQMQQQFNQMNQMNNSGSGNSGSMPSGGGMGMM